MPLLITDAITSVPGCLPFSVSKAPTPRPVITAVEEFVDSKTKILDTRKDGLACYESALSNCAEGGVIHRL